MAPPSAFMTAGRDGTPWSRLPWPGAWPTESPGDGADSVRYAAEFVVPQRHRESVTRLDRITSNPAVCHGRPSIRATPLDG